MKRNWENSWCFLNKYLFDEESDYMDLQIESSSYENLIITTDLNFEDGIQLPISPSFKNMHRNLKVNNNFNSLKSNDFTESTFVNPEAKEWNQNKFGDGITEFKNPNTWDTISSNEITQLQHKIKAEGTVETKIENLELWIDEDSIIHNEIPSRGIRNTRSKSKIAGGCANAIISDLNSIELIHDQERRWGKEEDRKLYQILIELNCCKIIQINDLTKTSLSKEWKNYMKIVWRKWGWKGPFCLFLRRVKNMLKQSQFSAREIILLKRILRREFKHKNLDYEAIAVRFPGKSIQSVCDAWQKIISEKMLKTNG